jgi:Domain of unknown function (DUF4375)
MPSQEYVDEDKLYGYLAAIRKKIIAAGGNSFDCLSVSERATFIAHILALEITNGGVEQFFINPSGDRWRETRDALKTVGAIRLAAIFDEALSVFPDGTPSTDQLTRCGQYEEAGDHAKRLMHRLTNEYYDLQEQSSDDCLYRILSRFAIKQLANERQGSG